MSLVSGSHEAGSTYYVWLVAGRLHLNLVPGSHKFARMFRLAAMLEAKDPICFHPHQEDVNLGPINLTRANELVQELNGSGDRTRLGQQLAAKLGTGEVPGLPFETVPVASGCKFFALVQDAALAVSWPPAVEQTVGSYVRFTVRARAPQEEDTWPDLTVSKREAKAAGAEACEFRPTRVPWDQEQDISLADQIKEKGFVTVPLEAKAELDPFATMAGYLARIVDWPVSPVKLPFFSWTIFEPDHMLRVNGCFFTRHFDVASGMSRYGHWFKVPDDWVRSVCDLLVRGLPGDRWTIVRQRLGLRFRSPF